MSALGSLPSANVDGASRDDVHINIYIEIYVYLWELMKSIIYSVCSPLFLRSRPHRATLCNYACKRIIACRLFSLELLDIIQHPCRLL